MPSTTRSPVEPAKAVKLVERDCIWLCIRDNTNASSPVRLFMRKHEVVGKKSLSDSLSLAARSYTAPMTLASEQGQHRRCRRTRALHTLDDALERLLVDDKPRGNIKFIAIRGVIVPHLAIRLRGRHGACGVWFLATIAQVTHPFPAAQTQRITAGCVALEAGLEVVRRGPVNDCTPGGTNATHSTSSTGTCAAAAVRSWRNCRSTASRISRTSTTGRARW